MGCFVFVMYGGMGRSGVKYHRPRSNMRTRFPLARSADTATVAPKPVPMIIASKVSGMAHPLLLVGWCQSGGNRFTLREMMSHFTRISWSFNAQDRFQTAT